MNPYSGQDFFGFFYVLFMRLIGWIKGPLVSDEIQMLTLAGIAVSCALVGSFLILHRMTMLANALSHTILLGIVVCMLLFPSDGLMSMPLLMAAAMITAFLTAFLTQSLQRLIRLQQDASIGLVFSSLFALGVLLISLYMRNVHVGIELIMGNADALVSWDAKLAIFVLICNVLMIVMLFRGYQITAFDPSMAKALGFSPVLLMYLLMSQTALTSISAFRCVGVFMVLAFLVAPSLIARFFIHRLVPLLIGSSIFSVLVVILGVGLSRHVLTLTATGVSTGGIIVTLFFVVFLVAVVSKLTIRNGSYTPP